MNPNYIFLKKMRIPELKSLCKEKKIRGFSKLRKQELVNLLFNNLYPGEQKVLGPLARTKEPSPEIVLKKEPLPEVVEPLESLEVKVLFEPTEQPIEEPIEKPTTTPMKPIINIPQQKSCEKTQEQFDLEYLKLLKEKMEQIKIKNEKKKIKKEKKEKENYLNLSDPDVIATINVLIRKIYK